MLSTTAVYGVPLMFLMFLGPSLHSKFNSTSAGQLNKAIGRVPTERFHTPLAIHCYSYS
jgi:hypothetical protein